MLKIMKQNTIAATLNDKNGVCEILDEASLPIDLYLEEGTTIDTYINNLENFYAWCSDRLLSLDRTYAKVILNACGLTQSLNTRTRAYAALQYHALTLTDFYWVQDEKDNFDWELINLYEHSWNNAVAISLTGKPLTVQNAMLIAPDCSTAGVSPKAWIRDNGHLYLLKGDTNGSVLKEIEASQILTALGLQCVSYDKFWFANQATARCETFTNKHTALVTAEQYGFNNDLQQLLQTPECCYAYHLMNLSDYLIGNIDRHCGNWGFLLSDTGSIHPAPLMDFNRAFEAIDDTMCLPEILLKSDKTQLQAAREAVDYLYMHQPEMLKCLQEEMQNFDHIRFCYGRYTEQRIKTLLS